MSELLETISEKQIPDNLSELCSIAPAPARLLAAFVDYLLQLSVFILLSHTSTPTAYYPLVVCSLGFIYFSLGNSSLFCGQTLGKKVFGLRCISFSEAQLYLSPTASALRYLASYGAILILAEGAPYIYRSFAVSAPALLLELPILLAFVYCFLNLAMVLFDSHRGLHDYLSASVVFRCPKAPSLIKKNNCLAPSRSFEQGVQHRFIIKLVASLLLGLLFWLPGVLHPRLESAMQNYQYKLAHDYEIILLSTERKAEGLLNIVFLSPTLEENRLLQAARKIREIAKKVQSTSPERTEKLILQFILEAQQAKGNEANLPEVERFMTINTKSGQITFEEK